jgi:hypothetical protein
VKVEIKYLIILIFAALVLPFNLCIKPSELASIFGYFTPSVLEGGNGPLAIHATILVVVVTNSLPISFAGLIHRDNRIF